MITELKEKMKSGRRVLAINLAGHNPDVVESLAKYGADIAFIDCERTGIGLDAATDLIRACRAARLPCVVRSWSKSPEVIVQCLDRQADGVVVPHVDTALETQQLVELMRYACGERAPEKLLVVQIETPMAVAHIKAMAEVDGVDVFLIGPNDLSYEMTGTRGRITPEVQQAIEQVAEHLRSKSIPFGLPCPAQDMEKFKNMGASLMYYPLEWVIQDGLAAITRLMA
jgi:4-hydroxy-2-oxoheptanedioate aldolase